MELHISWTGADPGGGGVDWVVSNPPLEQLYKKDNTWKKRKYVY